MTVCVYLRTVGWMNVHLYSRRPLVIASSPILHRPLAEVASVQVCARQAKRAKQLEEALSVTPHATHM